MIKVNYEIFQDSYFDFEKVLMELFAERKGRGENTAMTTGAGSTTIEGLTVGAAASGVTLGAAALTRDNIVDLIHSVDIAYRKSPSFRIMMNDTTMAYIRKLYYSAAGGGTLYTPGSLAGAPAYIENVPVFINNAMADIGASAKSILIGDFSKYKIRRVAGLRMKVVDQLYAATDQIGMDLLWRWDAQILNAGGNPIKYGVHAAT